MDLSPKWEPERQECKEYNNSMDTSHRQQQHLERKRCSSAVVLAPEVTEEELRHELALLGFGYVPQERLVEFKRDLEQLMGHQMLQQTQEDQSWCSGNRKEVRPEPAQATLSASEESARAEPSCDTTAISEKKAWMEPPAWTKSTLGATFCSERGAQTGVPGDVVCHSGKEIWRFLPAYNKSSQTEPHQDVPSCTRDQVWTMFHTQTDDIQHTASAFPKSNARIGCSVNTARTERLPLSSPHSENHSNTDKRQVVQLTTTERPNSCGGDSSSCASTASSSPQEESAERWRKPTMKRKVLRKSEDGRVQISDESTVSEMNSEVCWGQEPWKDETDSERLERGLMPSYSWNQRQEQEDRDRLKSFIRPRLIGNYQKKTDPVAKYQEYKRGWDAFQALGEKDRKELRWGMREQMLYKAPQLDLRRPVIYVPNNYIVPTEKKRSTLRWGVRYDLANGIIPHNKIYHS